MKIGIITFWDTNDNYGQIMQCYALSTYLNNVGHDTMIIRYKPKSQTVKSSMWTKLSPSHIVAYCKYRKELQEIKKRADIERNFDCFRGEYLNYSEKIYYGFTQLWDEDWSDFDAFICGSDQIWSPKPDEQLNAYFLQFAPLQSLRIAYAPSFGRSVLPEEYQNQLHNLLSLFDAVSTREKEGVDFCTRANIKCELVCDPTILLDQSDYLKLTVPPKRDNHIFCYLIKWDTLFPIEEINKIASNYSGIHYFYTNGQKKYFNYEKDQSIEAWLSAIQNSNLSLTNSFHGTVFSILSHTPFVVFPLSGDSAAMNNRIVSLLDKLGLLDRMFKKGVVLKQIIDTPIDWKEVDKRIESFRQHSKLFLQKALSPKKRDYCNHNICFTTRGSVHHTYGGLDRVTELLADYFRNKGANVYFVSQVQRSVYHKNIQYLLPDSKEFSSEINVSWFNDFICRNNIDVIINQEGNVDLTMPLNKSVKKITVLHFNPNYIDDNHFQRKFKGYPLLRKLFDSPIKKVGLRYLRNILSKNYIYQINYADYFVLLSDQFRNTLSNLLPQGYDYRKVLAINNPLVIDTEFNLVTSQKQNTVIYVGRIDNGFKNVDKLIKIWGKIANKVPNWNFEICGQGDEFEQDKALIAKDGIPRCKLVGLVNPEPYYKRASIIVMASSSSEGWGMVLVEAMQYGCVPIVLNSYASVRDIIKNGSNGVLIEPSTDMENNFAEQLLCLIQSADLRKTMMHNALSSVKKYDIKEIGQYWLKLIDAN